VVTQQGGLALSSLGPYGRSPGFGLGVYQPLVPFLFGPVVVLLAVQGGVQRDAGFDEVLGVGEELLDVPGEAVQVPEHHVGDLVGGVEAILEHIEEIGTALGGEPAADVNPHAVEEDTLLGTEVSDVLVLACQGEVVSLA